MTTKDAATLANLPTPDPLAYEPGQAAQSIGRLEAQPSRFAKLLAGKSPSELASTYRPGGWRVDQIVHHVVDSHLHSYMRCKYALCEDSPNITPYEENDWVATPDFQAGEVAESLELLALLHRRWVRLFRGLDEAMWNRRFHHPGAKRDFTLFQQVEIYAWHGDRHLAQAALALGTDLPP